MPGRGVCCGAAEFDALVTKPPIFPCKEGPTTLSDVEVRLCERRLYLFEQGGVKPCRFCRGDAAYTCDKSEVTPSSRPHQGSGDLSWQASFA